MLIYKNLAMVENVLSPLLRKRCKVYAEHFTDT